MGHFVVYQRIIVHVLLLVCYYTTVQTALSTFADKRQVGAISGHAVVQCNNYD